MSKKEGKIIATGINPQGVPWKEISFVEKEEKPKENDSINKWIKDNIHEYKKLI